MQKHMMMLLMFTFMTIGAFAQTNFETEGDVLNYLEGKTFYSNNGSIQVKIGYSSELNSYGVILNGKKTHFNLDITVLSPTIAVVKGASLSNPDGVIKIRVYATKNCLENDGSYYCQKSYE